MLVRFDVSWAWSTSIAIKFSPKLAELTKPLRDLLSKKNQWMWGQKQKDAFDQVKKELSKSPVLALYSPSLDTMISADASSYGLGAILLQKHSEEWKPVAFVSRDRTAVCTDRKRGSCGHLGM